MPKRARLAEVGSGNISRWIRMVPNSSAGVAAPVIDDGVEGTVAPEVEAVLSDIDGESIAGSADWGGAPGVDCEGSLSDASTDLDPEEAAAEAGPEDLDLDDTGAGEHADNTEGELPREEAAAEVDPTAVAPSDGEHTGAPPEDLDLANGEDKQLDGTAVVPHQRLAVPCDAGAVVGFGDPTCRRCNGRIADVLARGVRITRKSPPTFQCGTCGSKTVTLIRLFGTWPVPEFEAISEAEQKHFWSSCKSAVELKKAVVDICVKARVELHSKGIGGTFLPLSVYAVQGYDPADIEQNSAEEDKELHPVLGMTYRVMLKSSEHKAVESKMRQQILTSMPPNKRRKLMLGGAADGLLDGGNMIGSGSAAPPALGDGGTEGTEDGTKESEDSSSDSSSESRKAKKARKKAKKKAKKAAKKAKKDARKAKKATKKAKKDSSSSSSSSESKGEKPPKGGKVDPKQAEKEAQALLKAQLAAAKKVDNAKKRERSTAVSTATRFIAKIANPLLSLSQKINDPVAKSVPKSILQGAIVSRKELERIRDEANECINNAAKSTLIFDQDYVKKASDVAIANLKCLTSIIAELSKHLP